MRSNWDHATKPSLTECPRCGADGLVEPVATGRATEMYCATCSLSWRAATKTPELLEEPHVQRDVA